jgi:N-acyl-D-amino-acid deacylase
MDGGPKPVNPEATPVNHPIPRSCDTVIRGATVFDGAGAPRFAADVGVLGDRIIAVGDLAAMAATHEIDARGCALAPGFIDVHTHDDNALLRGPDMLPKVSQGVTTVVAGNCGISLAPLVCSDPPPPLDVLGRDAFRFRHFSDYVAALEANPPAVNAALLVGHSTLRVAAMSDLDRPATSAEIETMRRDLRESLDAGAIGFSTGLFYPTGKPATIDEVVGVMEALAGSGAVYATHMRNEADGVEDSLDESFETARRAHVPLVISHHKCMGRPNFGRSRQTLARIEAARTRQQVCVDVYPYTAGSTVLLPELIAQASRIVVSWSTPYPAMAGRDLDAIAAEWGVEPIEAMKRLQPGGGIYFMMDDADVERIMAYPHAMFGSDGLPHDRFPHPRLWGTFPRVLGHYARDRRLFPLEDAIHRMTGMSAERFGLKDRGQIRAGYFADLVLFDPEKIEDAATFEHPTLPARGIDSVYVNGEPVWVAGRSTSARPGRVLRRASAP